MHGYNIYIYCIWTDCSLRRWHQVRVTAARATFLLEFTYPSHPNNHSDADSLDVLGSPLVHLCGWSYCS